jgi:hypothetical protein
MHGQSFLGEAPLSDAPNASAFDQAAAEAGPSQEPGYYVYKRVLTANENSPDLTQFIDGDSEFQLVSIHGSSTGAYNINVKANNGKPIYSASADAKNVVGTAQLPVRVRPSLYFPPAGKIGISLQDTSGAPNTVELIFTGIRRFVTR